MTGAFDNAGTFEELLDAVQATVLGHRGLIRDLANELGLDPKLDFLGGDFKGIDLRGEPLAGFDFANADLSRADLRETGLQPDQLVGARLASAKLDLSLQMALGLKISKRRGHVSDKRANPTKSGDYRGGRVVYFSIPGVLLLVPRRHGDARGWFTETWSVQSLSDIGFTGEFVQDNQAFNARRGTVRGLHLQGEPHPQAKLVQVLRGSIFDVAVDVRPDSPTFGRWVGATLTAKGGEQLLVPRGFAHGYCTLTDDCELLYKVDGGYAPTAELGLIWNDPDLEIDWPISESDAVISDKDKSLPTLSALAKAANLPRLSLK